MPSKLSKRHKIEIGLLLVLFFGWGVLLIPISPDTTNMNTQENFPDPYFRRAVERYVNVKPNIEFTKDDILNRSAYFSCAGQNISNLKGIELLTAVRELDCSNNQIEDFDLSQCKHLTKLNCDNNRIQEIDDSRLSRLNGLSCSNNKLVRLDLSRSKNLTRLLCKSNQIDSVRFPQKNRIHIIEISNNLLKEIDLSNMQSLTALQIKNNRLNALDVSQNPNLMEIGCADNQIAEIDVTNNPVLYTLDLTNNRVAAVDLKNNPKLRSVRLEGNQLTKIPQLHPKAIRFDYFGVQNNAIDLENPDIKIRIQQMTKLFRTNPPTFVFEPQKKAQ